MPLEGAPLPREPLDEFDREARGNGGVLVTFRDMYRQLQSLVTELRDVNATMKQHSQTVLDLELRVRNLEKWRYSLPTALVISLASVVIALVR